MVRWMTVSVFCFAFGLWMFAQAPKEQTASEPSAKVGNQAGAEPAAAPKGETDTPAAPSGPSSPKTVTAANSQYPLDAFKNFSAELTGSLAGDDEVSNLYRRGNLMRTDIGKKGFYIIVDLSKGDTYGVTPDSCLHDPHPHIRIFPFRSAMHGEKVERVASGKETIDGHSCIIENVTVSADGPPPRKLRMRFWEAEDLQGFPIKIEVLRPGGHNVEITYSKVVLTPPDAALFKHPTKCEVLSTGPLPGGKASPPGKTPGAKTPAAKPPASKAPAADSQK